MGTRDDGARAPAAAGTEAVQPAPYASIELDRAPEPAASPPDDLWQRVRGSLSWQSIDNEQVAAARREFLAQHNYLPVVADRAHYYLFHVVEAVEASGLPMELALLPLVESTLNPFAYSRSGAAGLWQIMPATGRHLGLEQDWWYDGRRDLRDSTRVALGYLEELHREFDGDWLLALAAYNSGKGRVARVRQKNARNGLGTDFWSLQLPRETRHYVPRLIAITQIIAAPERYGAVIPAVPNTPSFEVAATGGQLELARAAELAGVDLDTLRAFNPGQLRWATSPDMPAELLVPLGAREVFEGKVAALAPQDRVRWQRYRIRRGDTLIHIAKRLGTSVGMIREVNGLRGSHIRAGDTLMIPQGNAWADSLALASGTLSGARDYRVRRGDSLYRIAGRFNVSVRDLIAWNALDPDDYLQPGQQLTLYPGGG